MSRLRFPLAALCLFALALFDAGAQTHPPDTIKERVRACAGCHGEAGQGTRNVYFPRLAGKPSVYLYNQLLAFKEGRRRYAPMNYLLAYLPDEYLMQMARYYESINAPFDGPQPSAAAPQVRDMGQQLVQNGAPNRAIPACMTCHGPHLSGRQPGIPGLVGLKNDYIVAQLGAWRYGTRTSREPDCMQLIAARMTEQDVVAVASYLSSMPVPAQTAPLPLSNQPLPLQCGSQIPPGQR